VWSSQGVASAAAKSARSGFTSTKATQCSTSSPTAPSADGPLASRPEGASTLRRACANCCSGGGGTPKSCWKVARKSHTYRRNNQGGKVGNMHTHKQACACARSVLQEKACLPQLFSGQRLVPVCGAQPGARLKLRGLAVEPARRPRPTEWAVATQTLCSCPQPLGPCFPRTRAPPLLASRHAAACPPGKTTTRATLHTTPRA
jgi:hypothetical protein